jgi:integrase
MKRREQGQIVEREKGRKYLIRWTATDPLTGARKRLSQIVNGDYVEAQSELSRKLRPPTEAQSTAPVERTFGDYAVHEWAQYVRDNWKASTQITQGSFVKVHIVPYFEKMLLPRIKPSHVVEFHTAMETKKLSKKTRRNLHPILTKMFTYAHDLELIPSNPVKKGIAPKQEKIEKPALTEEQLFALFDAVPIRHKAFYMTLAFTGIRTGEALGVKWIDVDFASHELNIRRAIYRGRDTTPKTSGSIRPRPMVDDLYKALLNHKAMSAYTQPDNYVFCSSSGRPMNPDTLREVLQTALKKLEIKFDQPRADGMHLLRHTSGSLVYRHTADVKLAQEWLGHSSSRITMDTYVHLMKDAQKLTAQAVFARPVAVPKEQQN